MKTDKSWLLKILTGPHVGSEAVLTQGVYLLGNEESCDIILHDISLIEQHFKLTLTADKISLDILAKDRLCYIDGVKVDSAAVEINPYQVISTGTLFFALGSAQEAWPPIELLGAQHSFTKVEENTESQATTKADKPPASPHSLPFIAAAWHRLWHDDRPISRIYLSVGIALIGIGASLLLAVFTEGKVLIENSQNHAAEIDQLIEEYAVDATVRTVSKDGQKMLYIHGYTKTDEQRDAFMEALGKANITAQIQLYSAERLRHAVSVILSQFLDPNTDSVAVTSASGSAGKVMLSGYVEQADVWQHVLDVIKMDISGLQGYDSKVHTMDDAVLALNQMLAEQQLSDKVSVNIAEHAIYLSTKALTQAEQQRLTTAAESFRERFAEHPQLTYGEQAESQIKQIELNIGLQAISFGTSPYLETQDGKRYAVGASLSDGYTIKEINRDFILLSKDGELRRYYFNKAR